MKSQYPIIIGIAVIVAIIFGITVSEDTTQQTDVIMEQKSSDLTLNEIQSIAEEAYIFGYPLVLMGITAESMTNVAEAGTQTAPINQFAVMPEFPTPDLKIVVSPNADTLYNVAWLDLSDEPIVLHVPDTNDRFYLQPMLDAYTNVFESPGKRTFGTGENDFAITGPSWDGTLPDGVIELKAPTEMVWIIGRIQTNGVDDYAAVHEIQNQISLTPLSSFGKPYTPPQNESVDPTIDMTIPPVEKVDQLDVNTFFNRMAMLMKANPPPPDDANMLVKFEKIDLIPGQEFDSSNLDPEIINALESGANAGHQKIVSYVPNLGTVVNGWQFSLDGGSYGTEYLFRAAFDMMGLGANLPQDAIYPLTYIDIDGNALNGANNYMIHFPEGQIPPVNAFWSLTMYNMEQFFVENPIDRYTIGDRSELVYNDDGSLDIYIQHEAPDGKESNWLPAPDDDFNVMMRLYWPSQEIIDGVWELPELQKISK